MNNRGLIGAVILLGSVAAGPVAFAAETTTTATAQTTEGAALEKGANSFTEGQAKSRIEQAGYTNVTGLKKDDDGIWRAMGTKNGQSVSVGLDFKGNVGTK